MKKLKALVFCLFTTFCMQAQVDTLTSVPHELRKQCTNGNCKWWVDGKPATESKYQAANDEQDQISKCKPCWLKSMDKQGKLTHEGYFYTDCCIGDYIERYDNGAIKVKGQYKTPKDVNDPNLYDDGYCRREGVWTYYKKDGSVEKAETYKDGVIINK